MSISGLFGALAQAFAHPHIDPAVAAAKIAQVQSGLMTAEAVVESLPEGKGKTAALSALKEAAVIAGQAIVVAHTAEVVLEATNASQSAG